MKAKKSRKKRSKARTRVHEDTKKRVSELSPEKSDILETVKRNNIDIAELSDAINGMKNQDENYYSNDNNISSNSSETLIRMEEIVNEYNDENIDVTKNMVKLLTNINNSILKMSGNIRDIKNNPLVEENEKFDGFLKVFLKDHDKNNDSISKLFQLLQAFDVGDIKNSELNEMKESFFTIMESLSSTFEFLTKEHIYALDPKAKITVHSIEKLLPQIEEMTSVITQKILNNKNVIKRIDKNTDESDELITRETRKTIDKSKEMIERGDSNKVQPLIKQALYTLNHMNKSEIALEEFIEKSTRRELDEDSAFDLTVMSKFNDVLSKYSRDRDSADTEEDIEENYTKTLNKLNSILEVVESNSNIFDPKDIEQFMDSYEKTIDLLKKGSHSNFKQKAKKITSSSISKIGDILEIPLISSIGEWMEKKIDKSDKNDNDLKKELLNEISEQSIKKDFRRLYDHTIIDETEDDIEHRRIINEHNETQKVIENGLLGLNSSVDSLTGSVIDISGDKDLGLIGGLILSRVLGPIQGIIPIVGGIISSPVLVPILASVATAIIAKMTIDKFKDFFAGKKELDLNIKKSILEMESEHSDVAEKVKADMIKEKEQEAIRRTMITGVPEKIDTDSFEFNEEYQRRLAVAIDNKTIEDILKNESESIEKESESFEKESKSLIEKEPETLQYIPETNMGTEFLKDDINVHHTVKEEIFEDIKNINNEILMKDDNQPIVIPIPTPVSQSNNSAPQSGSQHVSIDTDHLLLELIKNGVL